MGSRGASGRVTDESANRCSGGFGDLSTMAHSCGRWVWPGVGQNRRWPFDAGLLREFLIPVVEQARDQRCHETRQSAAAPEAKLVRKGKRSGRRVCCAPQSVLAGIQGELLPVRR